MDAMAYLKGLAQRSPNLRLGKALEKLAIAEKAEELRAEARTSRSSPREKTPSHPLPAAEIPFIVVSDDGWLSAWERNREEIEQAISSIGINEAIGRITPIYTPNFTQDTRRLTPGNCHPCVWGAVPLFTNDRGGYDGVSHVVECIHCGIRPAAVKVDPNAPAGHAIVTLPADADTERLDV